MMQEVVGKVEHHSAAVAHQQVAIVCKRSDVGELDIERVAQRLQSRLAGLGHRQHHALLRLGQPYFPRREPGILEPHVFQVYVSAAVAAHLADRRRQAACAAIGDRVVEGCVSRACDHLDQALLADGVANLHRSPGYLAGLRVHGHRRERRPAQAIPARASAQHDDAVARQRRPYMPAFWARCRRSRRRPAGSPCSPRRTEWPRSPSGCRSCCRSPGCRRRRRSGCGADAARHPAAQTHPRPEGRNRARRSRQSASPTRPARRGSPRPRPCSRRQTARWPTDDCASRP